MNTRWYIIFNGIVVASMMPLLLYAIVLYPKGAVYILISMGIGVLIVTFAIYVSNRIRLHPAAAAGIGFGIWVAMMAVASLISLNYYD